MEKMTLQGKEKETEFRVMCEFTFWDRKDRDPSGSISCSRRSVAYISGNGFRNEGRIGESEAAAGLSIHSYLHPHIPSSVWHKERSIALLLCSCTFWPKVNVQVKKKNHTKEGEM